MVTIDGPANDDDWHEATALLHDHVEWMRAATCFDPLTEQPDLVAELTDLQVAYSGHGQAVFLARWHGRAVGTVAVRCHGDGRAELKRMYIRAIARGRGIADALVAAALEFARRHCCHAIWLETMRGPMDPAIAVYRRNGFAEVDERPGTLDINGLVVMQRTLAAERRCA